MWGRNWLTAWINPTDKSAQRKSRWFSVIDTYMESMRDNNFFVTFSTEKKKSLVQNYFKRGFK